MFVPISHRTRHPGLSDVTSDRPVSRIDQAWPVVIALAAVIVFIVFLVQGSLLMAAVMALTTVVAAAVLVTLVTGTDWLNWSRRPFPHLRGHR